MKPYGQKHKAKLKTRWLRLGMTSWFGCYCFMCNSKKKNRKNRAREQGKQEIRQYVR